MQKRRGNISIEVKGGEVGTTIDPVEGKGPRLNDIIALKEAVGDVMVVRDLPEEAYSLLAWIEHRLKEIRDSYY